jgi:hypothetical protein
MGECPGWYELFMEAKFLGVPPWQLAEQPLIWRVMAREAMEAENYARSQQAQVADTRM